MSIYYPYLFFYFASKERDKSSESDARTTERSNSVGPSAGGAAQESLSIDETNKLRAKLGLKPLEVAEKPGGKTTLLHFVKR